MIKAGIVGASGYAGEELSKILTRHRAVSITSLTATSAKPNSAIKKFNREEVAGLCDLVFFSLPHTESMKYVPFMLKAGKKVIDLGADYRLKNVAEYEFWYKSKHSDKKNIKSAVYGLPEIYREKIKKAALVANPGCYPTASILAVLPLLKKRLIKTEPIIIDAKSGISGAGRKKAEGGLFNEIKENFLPYKVNHHQHMPEIDQELSYIAARNVSVNFTPHLLPVFRGLLATVYVKLSGKAPLSLAKIIKLYADFYQHDPFVRVYKEGETPQIRNVSGTNFCDIGIFLADKNKMLVIVSAIDNLIKGASGQAVENMNLMYGLKETEGLL